jgi:hypothetical protein
MTVKLWIVRDKGEVYALCTPCVMNRRLELFVDRNPPEAEAAAVSEQQGGRCRAEIEDYPSCLTAATAE